MNSPQAITALPRHPRQVKTIVIGSPMDMGFVLKRLNNHPEFDKESIVLVRTQGNDVSVGLTSLHIRRIEELISSGWVSKLVLSSPFQLDGSFGKIEGLCIEKGIGMQVLSEETERVCRKAGLSEISGIPIHLPKTISKKLLRNHVKRLFDFMLTLVALPLALPLCAALAIAIRADSVGPVLFRQRRSLKAGGPSFDLLKFRSMCDGADVQRDHLRNGKNSDPLLSKKKDDPRVTKIGRLMRRFSLDELPQLINVLRGEMSLVGPRPLPPRDFDCITPQDHMEGYLNKRAQAKPGLTGLWQVSGRSEMGFHEMLLLDMYYIENQSLFLDIILLLRTIPAVLFGKGAY